MMFILSNEKEDEWGKYFHHGELRKYMFPFENYELTKFQKDQIKRLKSCKYGGNILTLGWKEQLSKLLDEKYLHLLDQTMDDDYLKILIRTHLMQTYVTNNIEHLEIFKPYWMKELDDIALDYFRWNFDSVSNLSNVDRGVLGSGYTDFTGVGDGSASLRDYAIELKNGDFIMGICWEWYNK